MSLSKTMSYNSKKEKNVDIVMCIDATSSMGPCIDNVKANAKNFHKIFKEKMQNEYNTEIEALRIQVITFRDLECDVDALVKSEWFELPADDDVFERYIDKITPSGGGDYKESGLEALYTAMTTDWKARRGCDRQIIVLFTDADAIGFGEKSKAIGYPDMVSQSLILKTWGCQLGNANTLQEKSKRLVIFAPGNSIYDDLTSTLDRSQIVHVTSQNGMADISFDAIVKMICASASTF